MLLNLVCLVFVCLFIFVGNLTWTSWMKLIRLISLLNGQCRYFISQFYNVLQLFSSSKITLMVLFILWNCGSSDDKVKLFFPSPLFPCSQLGTWKTPFPTVLLKMFNCCPGRMPLSTVYSSRSRGVLSYFRYSKHGSKFSFFNYESPWFFICCLWNLVLITWAQERQRTLCCEVIFLPQISSVIALEWSTLVDSQSEICGARFNLLVHHTHQSSALWKGTLIWTWNNQNSRKISLYRKPISGSGTDTTYPFLKIFDLHWKISDEAVYCSLQLPHEREQRGGCWSLLSDDSDWAQANSVELLRRGSGWISGKGSSPGSAQALEQPSQGRWA